jgi:hypothetical protein
VGGAAGGAVEAATAAAGWFRVAGRL